MYKYLFYFIYMCVIFMCIKRDTFKFACVPFQILAFILQTEICRELTWPNSTDFIP